MPRSTLRNAPRDALRKTRGQDGVAFSFPVGLLRPLQHVGLSRRTTRNAQLAEVGQMSELPTIRESGIVVWNFRGSYYPIIASRVARRTEVYTNQ